MLNHEIISEEEWYNRLYDEKMYRIISVDLKTRIMRIFDIDNEKLYDVIPIHIKDKIVLEIREVD